MVYVDYSKLWKKLIDLKYNKTKLRNEAKIGSSTIARMMKGESVGLEVLARICFVLNCNIEDIMEFKYEK